MSHKNGRTVLLIEEDASLRRLIALGLQYRGMRVIEARPASDLAAVKEQRPDVLLVDINGGAQSDWSSLEKIGSLPAFASLPIVVLAWDDVLPVAAHNGPARTHISYLSKPFDARTLYAAIEQVLAETVARSSAQPVQVAQMTAPVPSIWPLVTAASLLLAVIGLLGSIALTGVGLLVLLVAVLMWGLGSKPGQEATAV